ncbi:MAG: PEP/pyruvate-binding domain-containing protein, partial [Candidatus Thermoplasmatota archaeon]|nr:PEP/pyruvate-binding domain-containing protein [Candidatus Thermoplasmatota archaeon]
MTHVVWAQDGQGTDLANVGGKGANLHEMLEVGLPVPEAFIVTAQAWQAFLEEADLAHRLEEALEGVDIEVNKELTGAARTIQQLILEAPMPKATEEAIRKAYGDMAPADDVHVAVRSSATAEDLPDASFAGQQDTFLHVVGTEDVLSHVRKCWASLYTPRAIYYREKKDFPHEKVHMAVVVQRMVASETSGVMFTAHPTTGQEQAIIEAAWGLGEGVVSGQVTPDNYVISRDGKVVEATVATKRTMVV